MTAKQLKQVQDDKIKVTDYFIGALPLLLKKFLTDSDKVAKLILIPQYFDWNMIGSSREDEVGDMVTEFLLEIVMMTT